MTVKIVKTSKTLKLSQNSSRCKMGSVRTLSQKWHIDKTVKSSYSTLTLSTAQSEYKTIISSNNLIYIIYIYVCVYIT